MTDPNSKKIGVFGWGVVAPKTPNVKAFEKNLQSTESWLQPFKGFGPSNFLVGEPDFTFEDYKPWIDQRFEPRKYSQLDGKMGMPVKYAIGAFIQALEANPKLEPILEELGTQAHIYIGAGLGDLEKSYDVSMKYSKVQRAWDRFWSEPQNNKAMTAYRALSADEQVAFLEQNSLPADPEKISDPDEAFYAGEAWFTHWAHESDGLEKYLQELREIESESIGEDIDASKGNVLRRKAGAKMRLNKSYGCPAEPWTGSSADLLWNIVNIPAAQISMLGKITGPAIAPVAACSGFGTCMSLAMSAIRSGDAKIAVIGTTDPAPHPLTVGSFHNARVLASDGEVCKPFTGMKGTHIAGGACVWIIGDADYLKEKGIDPIGLELLSVSLSSDAHHIITPSSDGPRTCIKEAIEKAGISADAVGTWDMHATATPGDWTELQLATEVFGKDTKLTARKGVFGHGMSVCGGWELTAQHMGLAQGKIHPVGISKEELHPALQDQQDRLVKNAEVPTEANIAGKINMGVGGINAVVISKKWEK